MADDIPRGLDEDNARLLARLERRPDVVQFINSRLGWFMLAVVQHGIWALRRRTGALRGRLALRPRGLAAMPSATVSAPPIAGPGVPEPDPEPAPEPGPERAPELASAPERVWRSGPWLPMVAFDHAILRQRPRILIDTTPTFRRQPAVTGGIGRVITNLAEAGVTTGLALPVRIEDGALFSYYSHTLLGGMITLTPDDIVVIADVFWLDMAVYRPALARVRASGARVALLVHDIGAIRRPELFWEEMPALFEAGLLEVLSQCSFCLGVSDHVQRDLRAYLGSIGFATLGSLQFGTVPLGVRKVPNGTMQLRALATEPFDSGGTFLSVGTVEPRKGYGLTLDACDIAWASGADFAWVIIGRYGWSCDALRARIEAHPQYRRRLFWLQDVNDAELAYAYSHCLCLIQSSLDEGFCLPVSEAALFGAAVIASDLPVIREIAGQSVQYYPVGAPEPLAKLMREAWSGTQPAPANFPVRSWTDTVRALALCVADPGHPVALTAPAVHAAQSRPVHVACCFDDGMAMPAGVLAASIAAATRDSSVVLHMLRAPALATDMGPLRQALESPQFCILDYAATVDTAGLHTTPLYTEATYYRLAIPALIDASRVIYLDCDTMVRRSVSGLWDLELCGHPIAATVDYLRLSQDNGDVPTLLHKGKVYDSRAYGREVLGMDLDITAYFNSGVMVMDLDVWRRTNLAERCRAECRAERELCLVDQDAANLVLQGDFLSLDQRWNAFAFLESLYHPAASAPLPTILNGFERRMRPPSGVLQAAMRAWADDPWIVHFPGRSKPWRRADWRTPYDREFWDHAFSTPFGPAMYERFMHPEVPGGS